MPDGSYLVKTMIGFKIAHINIQSLLPKFDELVSLLHYMALDVLFVTQLMVIPSIVMLPQPSIIVRLWGSGLPQT